MTGKRFEIDFDEEAITDNGEYCISLYCFQDKGERDVCDLLNQLNDENEQLKMENNSLKLLVQNWEALDEEKDGQLDKQSKALKKLKRENEQLKKELTEIKEKHEKREWEVFVNGGH